MVLIKLHDDPAAGGLDEALATDLEGLPAWQVVLPSAWKRRGEGADIVPGRQSAA